MKQSFGDGIGRPEEGIQSASILDNPGKVKLEASIRSDDHVGKQILGSAKNTSNYSTGHTIDVNFDRDTMKWLPQDFLLGGVPGIENEVQTCSQTGPYDLASGAPNFLCTNANTSAFTHSELFLSSNDVSPADSFALKLDMVENFQVSSVQDTFYKRYLKCHDDETDQELIWTKVKDDLVNVPTDLKQNKTKNIHKCTNYSLYNADWCNIPLNSNKITSLHVYIRPKKQYFNADHSNEPNCKKYRI